MHGGALLYVFKPATGHLHLVMLAAAAYHSVGNHGKGTAVTIEFFNGALFLGAAVHCHRERVVGFVLNFLPGHVQLVGECAVLQFAGGNGTGGYLIPWAAVLMLFPKGNGDARIRVRRIVVFAADGDLIILPVCVEGFG